ncbi:SpoIIE family protein phosphatase [Roseibium denhamense]|nr:SpoIIE family protein phosphatase [Roseibium denhamense]
MNLTQLLQTSRLLPTIAYSVGLGLIAMTVTTIWVADTRFIAEQNRIGAEVNLSGRQRMLSQRIGMIAQDMTDYQRVNNVDAHALLAGCADQMMRAHVALLSTNLDLINKALADAIKCEPGIATQHPVGDLSPELREAFFGGERPLDTLLRKYIDTAVNIASQEYPEQADLDKILLLANQELPGKLNTLVRRFQEEGEQSLNALTEFITYMWLLTLLLIALEVLLIFRPMARTIQRTMSQLQDALAASEANKAELKTVNDQLLESIQYARKIQEGVLPDLADMRSSMRDVALLWEPLQVVSGDYVWSTRRDNKAIFFVADCTGHGVPGALLTMVVSSELTKLLDDLDVLDPEDLMLRLDKTVRRRLGQEDPSGATLSIDKTDDGFEAALAIFDYEDSSLTYVGAGIPLFVLSQDGVTRVSADRHRLGYRSLRRPESFKVHRMTLGPDDTFYLATDGTTDHIGGDKKRAFGRKRLFDVLEANAYADLETQLSKLKTVLEDYRGDEPARDDYTVLAVSPHLKSSAGGTRVN